MTTIDTDEDDEEGEIVEPPKPAVIKDSRVATLRKPVQTLADLSRSLDACWSGLLVLKKNLFCSQFYLLAGSDSLVRSDFFSPANNLQINQRIRVDSIKIEDIEKSLLNAPTAGSNTLPIPPDSYSVLLALPSIDGKYFNYFTPLD